MLPKDRRGLEVKGWPLPAALHDGCRSNKAMNGSNAIRFIFVRLKPTSLGAGQGAQLAKAERVRVVIQSDKSND